MTLNKFLSTLDRRTFLKILSITGVSGLIYPRNLLATYMPLDISRIVVVEDEYSATFDPGLIIYENIVQIMINRGIKELRQEQTVSDAWKSLFPGITTSSIIAVKVNTLFSSMPTHTEVTYRVCESLKMMEFSGDFFPENNIIIYDETDNNLRNGGYTLNNTGEGIRCFGNDISGYSTETYQVHNSNQRISRVVTEMADYMVNISVLKNHSIAGITACLKNHYGTCNYPQGIHGGYCDPYIPALNALPVINDINVVNICDALACIVTGGPGGGPQILLNKIIMSEDIVATDYICRELLEENGCNTIYRATHVDTAAEDYDLGNNNPDNMEIIDIFNPSTGIEEENENLADQYQLKQNYPNPFNSRTQIQFYIPKPSEASLKIFNVNGQAIRNLVGKRLNSGWHNVSWDGTNESGRMVSSGVYLCRMQSKGFNKSIILELIK
ncbi:MAG: DUF362 domain-containing protein [candidate division Zixibacteria bacterium]|nr:DUF362 domain-containing protein [candidate division Zixibacteria bacterium]